MTLLGIGTQSLLPEGIIEGYGFDPGSSTYLLYPLGPLFGTYTAQTALGGQVDLDLVTFPTQEYTRIISEVAWESVHAGIDHGLDLTLNRPGFLFRWRTKGTADAWTEISSTSLTVSLHSPLLGPAPQRRGVPNNYFDNSIDYAIDYFVFYDSRLDTGSSVYDPAAPAVPTDGQDIEFYLIGPKPVSTKDPILIEGVGAGQLTGQSVVNVSNTPVLGQFATASVGGGITTGTVVLTALPGNAVTLRQLPVALYNQIPNFDTSGLYFFPEDAELQWRIAGSSDPWTVIPLDPATPGSSKLGFALLLAGTTPDAPVAGPYRIFTSIGWTVPTASAPANLDDIEFTVTRLVGGGSVTVLSAGQFVANVYDGLYSARDPVTQGIVSTGILYDLSAVLQMTDPVRIRITEPIEDAREWLEKYIYAPTGWVPALDNFGRISPVSQIAPSDSSNLPVIDNAIAEPSSEWDSGTRIINVLRFVYPRDYASLPLDKPKVLTGTSGATVDERQRKLIDPPQQVELEFRDEVSIARHGEQKLELDGRAFHAIGKDDPESLPPPDAPQPTAPVYWPGAAWANRFYGTTLFPVAPTASQATTAPARVIIPVTGDIADETGYQLAQLRQQHVHHRYSLGAPSIGVNVMRSGTQALRAGSWVLLDLTWLPDYITQRRGLLAMGQVIALGELDCAWRRLLVELVSPEGS
jgi:hypothetical protein